MWRAWDIAGGHRMPRNCEAQCSRQIDTLQGPFTHDVEGALELGYAKLQWGQ